jgi:hypothetical protein
MMDHTTDEGWPPPSTTGALGLTSWPPEFRGHRTRSSVDTILDSGGTGHWQVWPYSRARSVSYSACEPIQNQVIVLPSQSPSARCPKPTRTE